MEVITKIQAALAQKDYMSVERQLLPSLYPLFGNKQELDKIVAGGGIGVLATMLRTSNQMFIKIAVERIFCNLAAQPQLRPVFLKTEAIANTITVIQTVKDITVQQLCFAFLRNLTNSAEARQPVVDAGVLAEIVEIFNDDGLFDDAETFQQNTPFLMDTCALLATITQGGRENEDDPIIIQFAKEGGLEASAKFLKSLVSFEEQKHIVNPDIIVFLLKALQFVSQNYDNQEAMGKLSLAKDAIKLSAHQNKNIGKSASVLAQALTVDEGQVMDLSAQGEQSDELQILLSQAKDSKASEKQCLALGNLWNIAKRKENRSILRERGIIDICIEIFQSRPYVETLEAVLGVLSEMLLDQMASVQFTSLGGIAYLKMLLLPDDFNILRFALLNMFILSASIVNVAEMREMGVVKKVGDVLKALVSQIGESRSKNEQSDFDDALTGIAKLCFGVSAEYEGRYELKEHGISDILILFVEGTLPIAKQVKVDAAAALWNMMQEETFAEYLDDAIPFMTSMLSDINMYKGNPLARQQEMGYDEEVVRKNALKAIEGLNMEAIEKEISKMRKLEEDLNIDSDDDEEEASELPLEPEEEAPELKAEDDEEAQELQATEEEDGEVALQPAEDDEEELQPVEEEEELQPEEEELQPEEEEKPVKPARNIHRASIVIKHEIESQQQTKPGMRVQGRSATMAFARKTLTAEQQLELAKKTEQQVAEHEKKLKERYNKRKHIVNELLKTEEMYVDALGKVKQLFMTPLRTTHKDIITEEEFNKIFSVVELIYDINSAFYNELKKLYDKPDFYDNSEKEIGLYIVTRANTFKPYKKYVNVYDMADECLHKVINKNKRFAEFLDGVSLDLLEKYKYRQTDLASFLIMPVQRLPRYNLLLSDLLKSTDLKPGLTGYSYLQKSIAEIQKITAYVNESKRVAEHILKFKQLARKLKLSAYAEDEKRGLKKSLKDIAFIYYEQQKRTATKSKRVKGKLHICNDLLILTNTGLKIQRKVFVFPLKTTTIRMRQQNTFTLVDTAQTAVPYERKETSDPFVFEVTCPEDSVADEVYTEILNLIMTAK